jgi:histidinol-phosphate aminotransferase
MYSFGADANAGLLVSVPRSSDFSLDVPGIKRAVARHPRAKVLFVCSPNNPSGNLLSDAELKQLLGLPLLVVLDEAYIEFASQKSRIDWVLDHENLAVIRTFSKWAGLAGLRVGYGAMPEWLMRQLMKIKPPYNVNVAGQQAALASLSDRDQLMARVADIVEERERLFVELQSISFLRLLPSQTNFILCHVTGRKAAEVKQLLAKQGILVRYFDRPDLQAAIRISVGLPAQNDRLLAALRGMV